VKALERLCRGRALAERKEYVLDDGGKIVVQGLYERDGGDDAEVTEFAVAWDAKAADAGPGAALVSQRELNPWLELGWPATDRARGFLRSGEFALARMPGRPRLENARTIPFQTKLSEGEAKACDAAATAAGKTRSEWVREVLVRAAAR
jgi:hypothetical protein